MTHPVEGKYVEWPLRAALQDIDERLKRIEAAVFVAAATRAETDEERWGVYGRAIAGMSGALR